MLRLLPDEERPLIGIAFVAYTVRVEFKMCCSDAYEKRLKSPGFSCGFLPPPYVTDSCLRHCAHAALQGTRISRGESTLVCMTGYYPPRAGVGAYFADGCIVLKIVVSAGLLTAIGVVTNLAHANDAANNSTCQSHFTSEGNFLTGRKYSTWLEFPTVSKADAYSRIYTSVAKDGWNIVSSDKGAGVLSAAQSVSFGKGSQAPMSIVVETVRDGSKVTATFRIGGGQSTKEGTVRTKLCGYLEAVTAQ